MNIADALRELLDPKNGRDGADLGALWDNARAALAAHDASVKAGGYVSPQDAGEAHAARIIACVNACEGISDPSRLVPALRDLVEHADFASAEGRFADGEGAELDALDAAREALT